MEKIVIINGDTEEAARLRSCLRLLFPECEIQVSPGSAELLEDAPAVLT